MWEPEFESHDFTRVEVTKPEIFVHVLFNHYNPPDGIDLDKQNHGNL